MTFLDAINAIKEYKSVKLANAEVARFIDFVNTHFAGLRLDIRFNHEPGKTKIEKL